MLRAVLYSDDPNYWLDAYRKLDPVRAPDEEQKFLRAAEALFSKGTDTNFVAASSTPLLELCFVPVGWQVGSDPEIQVATVVSNHLTNAIMKYFGDAGRYQHADRVVADIEALSAGDLLDLVLPMLGIAIVDSVIRALSNRDELGSASPVPADARCACRSRASRLIRRSR